MKFSLELCTNIWYRFCFYDQSYGKYPFTPGNLRWNRLSMYHSFLNICVSYVVPLGARDAPWFFSRRVYGAWISDMNVWRTFVSIYKIKWKWQKDARTNWKNYVFEVAKPFSNSSTSGCKRGFFFRGRKIS